MSNAEFLAIVRSQFKAALDMFEEAVQACPEDHWNNPEHIDRFWHVAYHTLFYTDLYLGLPENDFESQPYHYEKAQWLPEDPAEYEGITAFPKEDILAYLSFVRNRLDTVMERLVDVRLDRPCPFTWLDMIIPECLLYNMRHLQHHASQLLLMMQQEGVMEPVWRGKG